MRGVVDAACLVHAACFVHAAGLAGDAGTAAPPVSPGPALLGLGCALCVSWLLTRRGAVALRRSGAAGFGAGGRRSVAAARVLASPRPGSAGATRVLLVAGLAVAALAALVVLAPGPATGPGAGLVSSAAVAVPLALAVAVLGLGTGRLRRRGRARAAAARRRSAVVEASEGLAAGLRAGLAPQRVLERTARDVSLLDPAASAARLGADVPGALRTAGSSAGAEGLAMLAAGWEVATRCGAGLADVVAGVAGTVRAEADRQRRVDVALAGARSTARLFAVLPLFGVALGAGMDANPVGVLTTTAAGAWCLCAGVLLAVTGLLWVDQLAEGVAR